MLTIYQGGIMKIDAKITVESAEQVQKILEEVDLKPFMELGEKIWAVKGAEFELNIPGGKLIYKPNELLSTPQGKE